MDAEVSLQRRNGSGSDSGSTLHDHRCLKDDGHDVNYKSCRSGYKGYTCTPKICEGNSKVISAASVVSELELKKDKLKENVVSKNFDFDNDTFLNIGGTFTS